MVKKIHFLCLEADVTSYICGEFLSASTTGTRNRMDGKLTKKYAPVINAIVIFVAGISLAWLLLNLD
jgi:hypothetical protein